MITRVLEQGYTPARVAEERGISVLWPLYSFLRNPDDYWETILTAIAVGGDVDTTAATRGRRAGAGGTGCGQPRA